MKFSWLPQWNPQATRNLVAFWIFGLCNNYAYVIMLSAAEDIMDKQQNKTKNDEGTCETSLTSRHCSHMSTGAVLLADIIPTLLVKISFPFFMHRIPFGNVISAWASGTGGAGVVGSLAYAFFTEPHLLNLSPNVALLMMLVVPLVFAFASVLVN